MENLIEMRQEYVEARIAREIDLLEGNKYAHLVHYEALAAGGRRGGLRTFDDVDDADLAAGVSDGFGMDDFDY